MFITPGSPWENGKCESFNGKFRAEFLDRNIHYSLKMLQIQANWWRKHYNQERPHSALDYHPPSEFAQTWADKHQEAKETKSVKDGKPLEEAKLNAVIQPILSLPNGVSTPEGQNSLTHTLRINLA